MGRMALPSRHVSAAAPCHRAGTCCSLLMPALALHCTLNAFQTLLGKRPTMEADDTVGVMQAVGWAAGGGVGGSWDWMLGLLPKGFGRRGRARLYGGASTCMRFCRQLRGCSQGVIRCNLLTASTRGSILPKALNVRMRRSGWCAPLQEQIIRSYRSKLERSTPIDQFHIAGVSFGDRQVGEHLLIAEAQRAVPGQHGALRSCNTTSAVVGRERAHGAGTLTRTLDAHRACARYAPACALQPSTAPAKARPLQEACSSTMESSVLQCLAAPRRHAAPSPPLPNMPPFSHHPL